MIERNGYKSMPETESDRRLLASLLRCDHELHGLPGFYTKDGAWTLAGANGFLIPVRNKDGLIQGMKIRLDDDAARKYRWLSSRSSRMEMVPAAIRGSTSPETPRRSGPISLRGRSRATLQATLQTMRSLCVSAA